MVNLNRLPRRLAIVLGVGAVALGAWATHRDVRRWYKAQPVRVVREATGRVLHSQLGLGTAVAVRPALRDPRDRPTRTNPARGDARIRYQPVMFRVQTGTYRDRLALAQNIIQFKPSANLVIAPGTQARLSLAGQDGVVHEVLIQRPPVRYPVLLTWLTVLLGAAIVLVRRRGLAFVAMVIGAGLATAWILVPAVAAGVAPIVAVAGYALILMVGFVVLSGQVNRKAVAALAGGVAGLAAAGVVAKLGSGVLKLSGHSSTYAMLLGSVLAPGVRLDLVGLIQCGTVLCILGVVLDVGISVASGVEQVLVSNPNVSRRDAVRAGLRMSRDITGMMLLTVIFVWAGEALPILLLGRTAAVTPLEILNSEGLAVDVVRLVAGAIGLLVAGPCSAAVAGGLLTRRSSQHVPSPGERPAVWWTVCALELAVCVASLVAIHRAPARTSPDTEAVGAGCAGVVPVEASADAYHRWACDQFRSGCANVGVLALWRALEHDPDHGPSQRDLAHQYASRRWFALAHAEARRAVALMPADSHAHYVVGITSGWMQDYAAAERHLREAVRLDPEHTDAAEALEQMFGPRDEAEPAPTSRPRAGEDAAR